MRKLLACMAAAGLILALSAPVSAEDRTLEERVSALEQLFGTWSFYGSARVGTWYEDSNLGPDSDDAGTTFDLQGNSRIGATVTKDKIGGAFEFGVDDDGRAVTTRLLYGTYDLGPAVVLFGQDYTPLGSMFYSNQVWGEDYDLLGFGQIYGGRLTQVKLMMKNGLEVALVENDSASILNAEGNSDEDVIIPKIEVRYHIEQDAFFADLFGGFSTFEVEDVTRGGTNYGDETVNAWALGVGGGLNLDPAYIKAQVYMARNAVNFGLSHIDGDGAFFDDTGSLVDEDNLGFSVIVGTMIDKYTVEAGYGYVSSEPDASGFDKDTAMAYYANVTIPVYDGFFFVPEVGFIDYADGPDGSDEDRDTTYFGAKWQIDF